MADEDAGLSPPRLSPPVDPDEPLTMDIIVAGLEAEKNELAKEIFGNVSKIDALESRNRALRRRLRDVKRMLTAAKPRERAKATPKAAK
jgi:hypothetical protein